MKAKVPYNDFVGTAAADNSDDYNNLKPLDKYLSKHGVNSNRYEAIGASFSTFYHTGFYASIICIDKDQSTESKHQILEIKTNLSKKEFFSLFKVYNVTITRNLLDYKDVEINDIIKIEDLNIKNGNLL
jgi:hypothetical protein